jgi:hypothetical protein
MRDDLLNASGKATHDAFKARDALPEGVVSVRLRRRLSGLLNGLLRSGSFRDAVRDRSLFLFRHYFIPLVP